MGQLSNWNVQRELDKFNSEVFVETGTGGGNSLSYAANFKFETLYSTEIDVEIFNKHSIKFLSMPRMRVYNLPSAEFLRLILPEIKDRRTFFWLDAHFPNTKENAQITLPLESELEIIVSYKDVKNDVILMDDLRVYEIGPYESGNCHQLSGYCGTDFVYKY